MKKIFVIMPFDKMSSVYSVIKDAVLEAGNSFNENIEVLRADELSGAFSITEKVIENLSDSDLIIADLSQNNGNVMYELGIAHGRETPTILISEEGTNLFFDLSSIHTLIYDQYRLDKSFRKKLANRVVDALNNPDDFTRPFTNRNNNRRGMRPTVFVSYSHVDKDSLTRLQVHLRPLEKENQIELWDDTRIKAGARWRDEIENALDRAAIAVLIISADFLASDFVVDNELPPLLQAAEQKGTTILPLILKPCRFVRDRNLSVFQAINDPSKPLLSLPEAEQEELYARIAERIENDLNAQYELPNMQINTACLPRRFLKCIGFINVYIFLNRFAISRQPVICSAGADASRIKESMNEKYLNEFVISGGAQRRAIRAADFHPPDARRFAPAISVCSGR